MAARLISNNKSYVKKFRLYGNSFLFKFNSPPDDVEEIDWVKKGFADIVDMMKEDTTEEYHLGFTLTSLNFKNREPGYVAFRPAPQITSDILFEIFGKIIQSNSEGFGSSDTFKITCTKVWVPLGRGRIGSFNNYEEECRRRKGIVVIKNDDSLPRSLVVAIAYVDKDPEYRALRLNFKNKQTIKARQLRIDADVHTSDLQKFQDFLSEYKITVYKYGSKGRDIFFEGENAGRKINLLFHDGHFNVITSLTSAFQCGYYCETCHSPFNVNFHTCPKAPSNSKRVRPGFYNNYEEECHERRGIVVIKNSDALCLPRSIIVGKANVDRDNEYSAIRKNYGNIQTFKAQQLMTDAGVQISDTGAGVEELQKFQAFLSGYKITVYEYGSKGRNIFFEGQDSEKKINLIFHNGHFNVITSLTAAFACSYYCETCHTPFDHRVNHRCSVTCYSCKRSPPCILVDNGVHCDKCNRQFKNSDCFANHLGGVCNSLKKCPSCMKVIYQPNHTSPHECGEVYCKTCKSFMSSPHSCYMKIDSRSPMKKDFLFVFFDLETRQDENLQDSKVHRVTLCVSQQYCFRCIEGNSCGCCSTRVFKEDPVDEFMTYVMDVRKQYKKLAVIAHNGQGFDFQFILKYVLEKTQFTPTLITRGTKVILMEIDNTKFIDSLNYMPMALSKLPKSFGLPPEKKKGYFPHLFNTMANQSYIGPIPPKEFYCPDSMMDKKSYDTFINWHNELTSSGYVFDFQKEIVEYCCSDVDILAQACIKFRSIFLSQCNVDPFLEAVTIASACNLAFRRNFLRRNTIGILPKKGYRLVDTQSKIALQWLTWIEDQRGIHIEHAGRGREVKVQGMRVDGYFEGEIFEFHGCYWHGCPKCFSNGRNDPLEDDPSDTLNLRLERTKAKSAKLSNVVEMWECEFKQMKKGNTAMTYLDTHPVLNKTPLNPRDAFFGGRTGNTKSYYACKDGETIQYVDICSLYPWVCKYGKFPVGHPSIHVGDRECRQRGMDAEGLLKCKVLPPRDLYHPVLPIKLHDKLMFVLCRSCAQTLAEDCEHTTDERILTGTWTMDEIRKAVEKGYTIIEMYEMWEYEIASFEKGNGLFVQYINQFLKIKQEASGYPDWCISEEERKKYVDDYFEHENIRLDSIEKNEGLRSLAKLMLNSFWGKFGQRENQTKTAIVRQPSELFKMLTSPSIQVNTIQEVNEDVILVNWEFVENDCDVVSSANVVIAAYTTAQARLKLYEHLDKLGRQVLYYDTDSVIYYHRPGMHMVHTGDYLGQMTNELSAYGQGSYITEFVSGGPKTYGYRVLATSTNTIETVCKVKGLTLNLCTSGLVNFQSLKSMVTAEDESLKVPASRIRRTKDREVVTVEELKYFKITGFKRKREGEYDSLPYGYIKKARKAT